MFIIGKEILISGGTGSLGKTLIKKLLKEKQAKGIRIFSRDEFKQHHLKIELEKEFGSDIPVSYLIGDIRDAKRLDRAMNGVDCVINTAAMKQVPACEYNPIEAVNTNIRGAENIINCAINNKVERVLHISTDKAVYPVNLYGATKTVAEKLFLHSNVYSPKTTKFSVCRYGNVIASRGSIIPQIKEQIKTGTITLTHPQMTRFFIHLDTVAEFIVKRLNDMNGDEIFIPKMASFYIEDLMHTFKQDHATCKMEIIGIRQGEKIDEILISKEESKYSHERENYFIISRYENDKVDKLFTYDSHSSNEYFLWNTKDIKEYIGEEYYD